MRVLARGRGVFAGAIVVAAACGALGVPVDFVLFGLTLAGVGLFHYHAMQVALSGLTVIVLYKLGFMGFKTGSGFCSVLPSCPIISSRARSPRCCQTCCLTIGQAASCCC